MYCSSCGTEVTTGLSYCNRCGTTLLARDRSATGPPQVPFEPLVWAIVSVTLAGLGAVIGLMAVMHEVLKFNDVLIIAFSIVSLLLILGVDSVLVWLLMRVVRAGIPTKPKGPAAIESYMAPMPLLVEPPPSVTEHTTRAFDPNDRGVGGLWRRSSHCCGACI
jgi:hypothetical protein